MGTMRTASLLSSARSAAITAVGRQQVRFISVGTDLTKSSLSWQKARPWYMDGSSNKAVDNALSMKDIFADKTVIVFGVPAPFTGTCTYEHFPPYKQRAKLFHENGVDDIICYTVADPYAHYNWGLSLKEENDDFDDITFLADPECTWAKENDLDVDYSGASLGVRSKRFSMLVKDGVVKTFHHVENAAEDAETLLCDVRSFEK